MKSNRRCSDILCQITFYFHVCEHKLFLLLNLHPEEICLDSDVKISWFPYNNCGTSFIIFTLEYTCIKICNEVKSACSQRSVEWTDKIFLVSSLLIHTSNSPCRPLRNTHGSWSPFLNASL